MLEQPWRRQTRRWSAARRIELGSWVLGLGDAHNFHLTARARAKPLKSWPLLSRHFSQVQKLAGKELQTNCFQAMKAGLSLLSPYRGMGHAERVMGRSRGEGWAQVVAANLRWLPAAQRQPPASSFPTPPVQTTPPPQAHVHARPSPLTPPLLHGIVSRSRLSFKLTPLHVLPHRAAHPPIPAPTQLALIHPSFGAPQNLQNAVSGRRRPPCHTRRILNPPRATRALASSTPRAWTFC